MRSGEEPGAVFFRAQLTILIEQHVDPQMRIADVGCGMGYWLESMRRWTGSGTKLYALDNNAARVRMARARVPDANLSIADARALPWGDQSFDLVSQFGVFTSVLGSHDRRAIAREMRRVVKPGGLILWYDFFAPNPLNRNTRRVGRKEITTLFPDCRIMLLRRVTLLPPLARLSLRVSRQLAELLNRLPFLRTHYFALIECQAAAAK